MFARLSAPARLGRLGAVGTAIVLLLSGLTLIAASPSAADIDPAPGTPATVTADALPTTQINGVVWSQATVGNIVYAGGNFTKARPPGAAVGTNEVTRNNLLAYNLQTGQLVTSFAPNLNGQVRVVAASPDGKRLYVGGDFTQAEGQTRSRIAAYDVATGQLVSNFRPLASTVVRTITATNSTVYFGGDFRAVDGIARGYAAAVSAANGAVLNWNPQADTAVTASTLTADGQSLILGGRFTTLGGVPALGMGSVDPATAAGKRWDIQSTVQNYGKGGAITALAADADGVYGTGYAFYQEAGNFIEGSFRADPQTGAITWLNDCHGDSYSVFPTKDVVYTASHAHSCGTIGGFPQTEPWTFYHANAFSKAATGTLTQDPYGYPSFPGRPSPTLLNWYPTMQPGTFTGQSQAGWSVTGNEDFIAYGGEFPRVNGVAQQGLVRYAVKEKAPNKVGPRYDAGLIPAVFTRRPGQARVSFKTTSDLDNEALTYKVYRNFQSLNDTPIYETTVRTPFWKPQRLGFVDKTVQPGKRYNYRVYVYDSSGNSMTASATVVDIPAAGESSAYSDAVLADSPDRFYRLDEQSGSTVFDWANANDATANASVRRGVVGATGDSDTASTFDGGDSLVVDPQSISGPNTFTVEGWFKTSSTRGGKIVGFGNATTGNSNNYDRHVYMTPDGRITFGVYPGAIRTVSSSRTYNDGQWHYFAASLGSQGMRLFIDGKQVGARTDTTFGQDYSGYWRIGGDSAWEGDAYFTGDIDDVATYSSQLSKEQVNAHWMASGRDSALPTAPADAYGAAVFGDAPELYWRLGESSGDTAADASGNDNAGRYFGDATRGGAGIAGGDSSVLLGRDSGQVVSQRAFDNPSVFAQEVWIKTTSTTGGRIFGFGDSGSDSYSGNYDRQLYMLNDGRVRFGLWTGQENLVTSGASLNDGKWHHVVSQVGPQGMQLFVDGKLVDTNSNTGSQGYSGYWKLGGDNAWGGYDTSQFNGMVDEAAIYSAPLSASKVQQHYDLGTGKAPNAAPQAAFTQEAADLTVTFDGSSSTDADGTVESYSWDFGDGATSTEAKPTHTFDEAGTYQVKLTVTDDEGAIGAQTMPVTVQAGNVAPTASFTVEKAGLEATFDGTASSDSDGTIESYDWDFGDGSTGTGATVDQTYARAGTYTVELTVTDNRGGNHTTSADVTVAPPANVLPRASFTSSASGLTATFDGRASSDPDGTIESYAWDFGDGSQGTGAQASRAYSTAGTYDVELTVTDNRGGTHSKTERVTVTAPPASNVIAADAFSRTQSNGWGSADKGGAWSLQGAASIFSVNGGDGIITIPRAGSGPGAFLNSVSQTDADATLDVMLPQRPSAGSVYLSVSGRGGATDGYRQTVRVGADGAVGVVLSRAVSGTSTDMVSRTVTGMSYAAGDTLLVRAQVTGTSPTTSRIKVWKKGTVEPSAWTLTTTDATPRLQTARGIGFTTYLGGSATNVPFALRFSNFAVTTTN